MALALVVASVATGCSSSCEDSLVAEAEDGEFTVGSSLGEDAGDVHVVCPYDRVSELGPEAKGALSEAGWSETDEGRQWLVVERGSTVQVEGLSRDRVDFCGGTGLGTLQSETRLTASQGDGGVLVVRRKG